VADNCDLHSHRRDDKMKRKLLVSQGLKLRVLTKFDMYEVKEETEWHVHKIN
jgi:hypothetical protein